MSKEFLQSLRLISITCLVGAVLVMIAVMIGTHLPPTRVPSFVTRIAPDKILHAVGYGALAFLLYGGVRLWFKRRLSTFVSVVFFVAALSALDEITQPWTGRDRDLLDFLASSGGALIGATTALLVGIVMFRLTRSQAVGRSEDHGAWSGEVGKYYE